MKSQNKEDNSNLEINQNKELTESLRNIKLFNDKMLLSTSLKSKEILLWSENSGTVAFIYNDENLRTFIPTGKIKIIDPKLYSEYFIYLHENKSLFNVWNTSNSQYYSKFSCTDEKITCFCISNDSQILYVGTASGYLISYNLAIGKILRNVQICKNEILKVEQIENILVILTVEKIIIYNFSSFLDCEINTQIPKEIISYNYNAKMNSFGDNKNINDDNNNYNYVYKNFIIDNNNNIYLWSDNSVILLNIKDLKPFKLFHIIGENEEYKKLSIIDKIIVQDGKILFNNGIKEIFSFNSNDYNINNIHEIKISKNNSVLYLPNNIKFSLGNITVFILGTKNNIITGHEDGKICIWKQKAINSLFYAYENMFQIHKGAITNILLLNKPISQYGLNFNKQISECVISKIQNKQIDKIKIKINNNGFNSIENFINENIESNMNDCLIKMHEMNNINKEDDDDEKSLEEYNNNNNIDIIENEKNNNNNKKEELNEKKKNKKKRKKNK